MSKFAVEVVKLGPIHKHPNADALHVTNVFGYPVVVASSNGWKEGDLAAYIPVDAVVPFTPEWDWLGTSPSSHRIKAKRLRGIFSMGLLLRPPEGAVEGQDIAAALGITKHEDIEPPDLRGENMRCPVFIPTYTDLEGWRRYQDVIKDGEPVILMEKIHGCNARFVFLSKTQRLYAGSRTCIKKETNTSPWWIAARDNDLELKLSTMQDMVFFGEVYGQVQDLTYGVEKGQYKIVFFDIFNLATQSYLPWHDVRARLDYLQLQSAPILYEGPWSRDLLELANGPSAIGPNIREGFVVRPATDRWNNKLGRVILKMVGEQYLLRKGGTERH